MGQSNNGDFISDYTGLQIDEAIARASEALEKATANETALAGKASQESLTSLLSALSLLASRVSALEQNGGGASSTVIANVNLLQQKIDELIDKLANSAFKTTKPAEIGTLDWGSSGTTYYTITIPTSSRYTMTNNATIIEAGQPYENTITAKAGYDLTSVTVNGVSQTISNNQCTIHIASVQSNITIEIAAQSQFGPVTTYQVTTELSDLVLTPSTSGIDVWTVEEGGPFIGTLALAENVTGKRLPDSITIAGLCGTNTYNKNTGEIEITNIQSDILITAAAISDSSGPMHNVTYNLTGCSKSSGPDTIEEGSNLTVVLAKDTSNWSGLFGEDTNWANAFDLLARDIIVMMNGLPLERGVDFTATKSGNNITVNIPGVTGDVEIINVLWMRPGIKYTDGAQTTGTTSARTDTYIPVPQSCVAIAVYGPNTNTQLSFGCALYNADKTYNNGAALFSNEVTMQKSSGVGYIRTSAKLNTQNPTSENSIAVINNCYIYDITNGKFIWKGDNVTGRQN